GIIGSGAIESAHRTVIQHRMKQAGQRWTAQGAQNMLNLRVIKENGQWARIIHMAPMGLHKPLNNDNLECTRLQFIRYSNRLKMVKPRRFLFFAVWACD